MELVIDTSAGALSVALIDGDTIVADHHVVIGRGHAEEVVVAIAGVTGVNAAHVTDITVGTGPGSFTGVRIGIAAARALGLAWDVPVAGVSSLALVAAEALATHPRTDRVTVVADAGRGRLYHQSFTRSGATAPPRTATQAEGVLLPEDVTAGTAAHLVQGVDTGVRHPRAAAARSLWPGARGASNPLYLGGEGLAA